MTAFTSTYRLQLHRGFDLDAAAAVVPYLRALGVDVWGDTSIEHPDGGQLTVGDVLADLPVALLRSSRHHPVFGPYWRS